MLKTIEVEIDGDGIVRPLQRADRIPPGRGLLTLLPGGEEAPHHFAETALAEDWLRPEEDAAWAHLQPAK